MSAADTKWTDLLISLGKLIHNKNYTLEEVLKMSWDKKCELITSHSAACARYFNHRVQKFFKFILRSSNSQFGILKDFFYRIEFQHRGSPHIHGLLWIENAPKFQKNSDSEVCKYIDQISSCSTCPKDDEIEYVKLQKHKHSKTCRRKKKGVTTCRFGAPWPPMLQTQILYPLGRYSPSKY